MIPGRQAGPRILNPPTTTDARAQGAEYFTAKVDIEPTQASRGAIAAIEAAGGKIRTVYYGQTFLRHHLSPEKRDGKGLEAPKNPRPPLKRIGYWLSWENRGYLSPEAQIEDLTRRSPAGAAHADDPEQERA